MPTGRSISLLVPTSEVTNKAHQNKSMHAKKGGCWSWIQEGNPHGNQNKGFDFHALHSNEIKHIFIPGKGHCGIFE